MIVVYGSCLKCSRTGPLWSEHVSLCARCARPDLPTPLTELRMVPPPMPFPSAGDDPDRIRKRPGPTSSPEFRTCCAECDRYFPRSALNEERVCAECALRLRTPFWLPVADWFRRVVLRSPIGWPEKEP